MSANENKAQVMFENMERAKRASAEANAAAEHSAAKVNFEVPAPTTVPTAAPAPTPAKAVAPHVAEVVHKNIDNLPPLSAKTVERAPVPKPAVPAEKETESIIQANTADLVEFANHPFKVRRDAELEQLARSIEENGLLVPITVRPNKVGNGYEIISGHRRAAACRLLNIKTLPVIVRELDDNAAAIALVDSNMQREVVMPSEKAFAYKMKMEAIKAQGKRSDLTSCQVGTKLRADVSIAENSEESARTIQRYIRLTNLIPELLQLVDNGKIALNPAVELSYLPEQAQHDVYTTIESEEATPSLAQAKTLRTQSEKGLSMDDVFAVLSQQKPNQQETVKIKLNDIKAFIPQSYTQEQVRQDILKGLELLKKQRQRTRNQER